MSRNPSAVLPVPKQISHAVAAVAIAFVRHSFDKGIGATTHLERMRAPRLADIVMRATVSPASTTSDEWAGALQVESLVLAYLSGLPSAGGALFRLAAIHSPLNPPARIVSRDASAAPRHKWTAEGGPIAVAQFDFKPGYLVRGKLAVICLESRELTEASDAIEVVSQRLDEDAAAKLDAAMLSDDAATADSPAGLLLGATPVTGSADPVEDWKAAADAIPRLVRPCTICSPGQAAVFQAAGLRDSAGQIGGGPVLITSALPKTDFVVLDLQDLQVGGDAAPRIESAKDALLVSDDGQFAVVGADGTVTANTLALYQMDLLALRSILVCSWGWRDFGRCAVVTGASW